MKKALITGITGQDGSYLAESLLDKGYDVYGMHRRASTDGHLDRIKNVEGKLNLVCGDLLDLSSLSRIINDIKPDELYNLAAQSQVAVSFKQPYLTKEINRFGVERILDILQSDLPSCKIYQASTSEMFGDVVATPQNENTPFNPVSPYAEAKVKAHEAIVRERENGLFACSGILFNHESPRRGLEFVTRKFTNGIARIKLGLPQRETGKDYIEMGNLNAERDWGFAGDYVKAMHAMLQQDKPDDYVIATGVNHTVREFIEAAADAAEIKINWEGEGLNETGYDTSGKKIIAINPKFFREREVNTLRGDCSKAKQKLGWKPTVSFESLIEMMVQNDIDILNR